MRKIAFGLIMIACASALPGATLTVKGGEPAISFHSSHVSFNSSTGYIRGSFGFATVGTLAGEWKLYSLLDSYSYVWKDHLVGESAQAWGLSLAVDEIGVWALSYPQKGLGYLAEKAGFSLGAAYFDEGDEETSLFKVHGERSGLSAALFSAGYQNGFIMARMKLSSSDDNALDLLFSGGLSYKGLSFIYIRGNEANVLEKKRSPQAAWHLLLDGCMLSFHLSFSQYNEPVRLGTYRRREGRASATFSPRNDLVLKSSLSSTLSEEGSWSYSAAYSLRIGFATVSYDRDDGFELALKLGSIEVSVGRKWKFSCDLEKDWWRLSFSLSSDGTVDTSFSVEIT